MPCGPAMHNTTKHYNKSANLLAYHWHSSFKSFMQEDPFLHQSAIGDWSRCKPPCTSTIHAQQSSCTWNGSVYMKAKLALLTTYWSFRYSLEASLRTRSWHTASDGSSGCAWCNNTDKMCRAFHRTQSCTQYRGVLIQ